MDDINKYLRKVSVNDGEELLSDISTPSLDSKNITEHWTGKVVDNDDPMKMGRCKIRIFGFYDELPKQHIPWAILDSSYIGATVGNLVVPELNTIVRGYFENGDIQKPVYNSMLAKPILEMTPKQFVSRLNNYPNTMILLETDGGDSLTLDRRSGNIVFSHRSGMSMTIQSNGSITVTQNKIGTKAKSQRASFTLDVAGDLNIKAGGNINITSKATVAVQCGPTGFIDLGDNPNKLPVNNLQLCCAGSAPHSPGNTKVRA